MKAKNIVFTMLIVTLLGTMLFAVCGVKEAQAYGPEPTLYLDQAPSRTTTAFTTPYIWPRPASAPATLTLYLRIARAPRVNTAENPAAPTDKTAQWQVRLSYDPQYFSIVNPDADIVEKNFLKWNKYVWNDPDGIPGPWDETPADEYWQLESMFASTFLGKADNTAGVALMSSTIWPPTPDRTALPAMYFDSYAGPYAPNKNRHAGSYYDLPYTINTTQRVVQPDGTAVTDPNYNTCVSIMITMHTMPPVGYTAAFHLYDTILWCYDAVTTYAHTTVDAYFAGIPPTPEFPLGLAPLMLLAPAIPIVYLWRKHPKKRV